jgi:amino acid transporter
MSQVQTAPGWRGIVSARSRTPVAATALFSVFVLEFSVARLVPITSAVIIIVFILVNFSFNVIRRKAAAESQVPWIVPCLGTVSGGSLVVAQFGLDLG